MGLNLHRYEDQQKVKRAITLQRVDPADIPATAKVAAPPAMVPSFSMPGPSFNGSTAQKRKYQPDVANGIQNTQGPLGDEDEDFMPAEPELADELYCVVKTSIVGVQYYKGTYLVAYS